MELKPLTYDDVTPVTGKAYTHCLEASDLGLKAGQFPEQLPAAPKFGNGQPLVRQPDAIWSPDDELIAVVYMQMYGVTVVHLLND